MEATFWTDLQAGWQGFNSWQRKGYFFFAVGPIHPPIQG